jgi:hypothetical protein
MLNSSASVVVLQAVACRQRHAYVVDSVLGVVWKFTST